MIVNKIDELLALESHRDSLHALLGKLNVRKSEMELRLGNLNGTVRGRRLSNDQYNRICNEQADIKKEMSDLLREREALKPEIQKARDAVIQFRRKHSDVVHEMAVASGAVLSGQEMIDSLVSRVLSIRAEYLAFAADSTRVASMRRMAAEFVDRLEKILKDCRK